MNGPLRLTLLGNSYFAITHAGNVASLGCDGLGMDTGVGKVDQLKSRLKVPGEPSLQLGIDIDFYTSADTNVAPTAQQYVSCVKSLNANLLSISFPFHTNGARTRTGSLTATTSILQLYFGQPLMTPEGAKSPASFVATAGASAIAKSFPALGGAS
jgi:hypothetical protein